MYSKDDKVIVVDLELTCWEGGTPPPGQRPEIIQIGYCMLDLSTLDRVEKGSLHVQPVVSTVTPFCTQLTGITPKRARGGVPLDQACKTLMRKVGSRSRCWASWGFGDSECVKRECELMGAEYPFGTAYMDIQLLATNLLGMPIRTSLENALKRLGIDFEGRAHDGADDAWNTAAILAEIVRRTRL